MSNLAASIPDDELMAALRDRLGPEEEWLFEELERRYVLALYREYLAHEREQAATWFARLGAQS